MISSSGLAVRFGTVSVIVALVLAACAPTPPRIHPDAGKATVQGYSCLNPPCYAHDNINRLTKGNTNWTYKGDIQEAFPWSYEKEWRFNRDSSSPPKLCLAMSGGGLRSAAVNIGILGALYGLRDSNGKRLLDLIDVISGVSGGSSALAWYYAQQYHLNASPSLSGAGDVREQMFADETESHGQIKHQQYLADNYVTFSDFEYWIGGAGNVALIPANLAVNGVFGWHFNTSPMRSWYESRLRQTFLWDPQSTDPHSGAAISIKDLGAFAKRKELPLFVIGATALIERDFQHFGARLGNIVFEFTPDHFGSDAFGRHPYDTDAGQSFTLSRVLSISSAAFDGAQLLSGPSQTVLWSVLNWDTGMYVHNPNLSSSQRFWHHWLPFPFYFFKNYLRDMHGTDIYLSDGGHAENLAVYPLVRRRCGKIIVVDAEHDPGFIFESYERLKDNLRAEMGVMLDVPGIATIHKIKNAAPRGPRWEKVAIEPIMTGSLSRIPYIQASETIDRDIRILYVKMSYIHGMKFPADSLPADNPRRQEVERRRQAIESVFGRDERKRCEVDESGSYRTGPCPFPHRTTKDQSFTPLEYRAWRNLGRVLAVGYSDTIRDFVDR